MKNRKFGVELEANLNVKKVLGIDPQVNVRAALHIILACQSKTSKAKKLEICHHEYRTNLEKWTIKEDGSLNHHYGFEMVSPILQGRSGLVDLGKMVNMLNSVGCEVDARCGMHVHVDVSDLSEDEKVAVATRYSHFHDKIEKFVNKSRWNNYNCERTASHHVDYFLTNILREGKASPYSRSGQAVSISDRYPTLEFRHHEGCLDVKEVQNWVKFCINFVEQSVKEYRKARKKSKLAALNRRIADQNKLDVYLSQYRKVLMSPVKNDSPTKGMTPGEIAYLTRLSNKKHAA